MEGALGRFFSSSTITQFIVIECLLDPEPEKITGRGRGQTLGRLCRIVQSARGSKGLRLKPGSAIC